MEKRGRIVQRFPTTPFETSFPYFPQQRWPTGFVHKFQLISGMTPSQEESILSRALGLPEAEREAFLVQACAGDADLKKRVVAKLLAPRPSNSPDSLGTQTPTLRDESTPLFSPVQTHETLGRYRIRELIGEGGCGVVYAAEQTEPVRREVAIKVIKMGMDTKQVVARFEAERQALALMDHPCIAKVLDAGATDSGRPYFVMELIRGIRITTYCEREALSISKRLELFIKVCQAIQHAHQKGIIHRDIKPSNILVARRDDEAVPKVIDFGIAKALPQMRDQLTDSTVFTQVHQFIGTPAYMSPEQATLGGVDIDTRTDIYSLGVVLYELLCGVPPFDAQELLDAGLDGSRKIVQEREPIRPSLRLEQRRRKAPEALREQIPTDLDWIVMKCLEKDRNRRYETANGLAMDIERFLHHEPVVARSPTTFYRLKKAWRRNRGLFATGVTAGLSLASASIISTWQWIEAVNARNKAEHSEVAEREARLTAVAEREKSLRLLYAANIQLIQQAWEHNNLGRMRALLQDTATSPGRGFEWFYWDRVAHQAEHTFQGHSNSVWSVCYAANGRRLASAAEDGSARIWNLDSRTQQVSVSIPGGKAYSVAFTPDDAGLFTANEDGTASLWDARNGTLIRHFAGHGARVYSVHPSPDGSQLVTASEDNTVRVWRVADGRELLRLTGHSGWVRSATFSPDGQRIASGSDDATVIVWNATDGRELQRLRGHQNRVYAVAWSPDGQSLATASWDGSLGLWNPATGALLRSFKGHSTWVRSVQFSRDGQRLVSGGEDQTSRIWDVNTGAELLQLKGHSLRVRWAVFSPDGQQVATAGGDNTVRLWKASGDPENRCFEGHRSWVRAAATTSDGKILATAANDLSARVWDLETGQTLRVLLGHSAAVNTIDVSPNGREVITGSSDGTFRAWDLETGAERLRRTTHGSNVFSASYSRDGARWVTAGSDSMVRLWDASTGTEIRTLTGHSKPVLAAAFSPDGSRVGSASEDATARLWDAATGSERHTLRGHTATVRSIAFSPDGTQVATAGEDKLIRVWETRTGSIVATLRGHGDVVISVAYSPDGTRLVSSSTDETARLWDAASGRELMVLRGHDGWVWTARFSRDGRRIITGGFDQRVRVWEAALPAQSASWAQQDAAELNAPR